MRLSELLRLVWMNISRNKFKSIMTSIGIVVGAATIVMVISIGQGGKQEVAEQFAQLNAGAIDVSYEYKGEESADEGFSFGRMGQFFGNLFGGGTGPGSESFSPWSGSGKGSRSSQEGSSQGSNQGNAPEGSPGAGQGDMPELPSGAERPGGMKDEESQEGRDTSSGDGEDMDSEGETEASMVEDRLNQEQVILTQDDVEDIERYVDGIEGATISYTTRASVEGGQLVSEQSYTVAGIKDSFFTVSKLELSAGEYFTEEQEEARERVCVLGAEAAKEIFSDPEEAVGENIYIADRSYTVTGILKASQTVSAGISPDTAVLIPYETGIKYITGTDIDPVLMVIARNVDVLSDVIGDVRTVLEENYVNAKFTFEDSGSKMEAAQSSNRTLTMLLSAMAAIVFLVGGIGIMNVLFVSVKERTNEIGILKAIGTSKGDILLEFLLESAAISIIGGVLGVAVSLCLIPAVTCLDVRVEVGVAACMIAMGFSLLTGTTFGIYPAWKASRLEPVEALNEE